MSAPLGPRCVLVTGGAGFIGSNLVRWLLRTQPELHVVNLDLLTYAGNLESLEDVEAAHGPRGDGRYHFVHADIGDFERVRQALHGVSHPDSGLPAPPADAVMHLAAESHVDRSIMGPRPFVDTNVCGTLVLLEACRAELLERPRPLRLLHVSTDEVYGSLGPTDAPFIEQTPLAPTSPYAASKAGSDLLVLSYVKTFDFPALITRCSNNYGPYQFPEKLIPLMITRALRDEPLPVYGDGENVRDWIYVEDHAAGLWAALERGRIGEVYNLGGESEVKNLDLVRRLLGLLGKPESLITFVNDRLGHDRRYAMNVDHARAELGWVPHHRLEDGLAQTVEWYLANRRWWERVLSEAHRPAAALYLPA